MVPPKDGWTPFFNDNDKLCFFKQWGLVPKSATTIRPVVYCGVYTDKPVSCQVVGYSDFDVAVILVENDLHCIDGECLAEMQPKPKDIEEYVVLDIETTGFNRTKDKLIEVAAARYRHGEEIDTFHSFVNPKCEVPDTITKLTGICQCDVDTAPCVEEIVPIFVKFIGNLPLVGHNIFSFDIPFLETHMGVHFSNILIDTLILSKKEFPQLGTHKLSDLKELLGLSEQTSHRALSDVRTTNELFLACKDPKDYKEKISNYKKPLKTSNKSKKKLSDKKQIFPDRFTQILNPNSPLAGKVIVFTGEMSIPRDKATEYAVNCNAIVRTAVSKKTNYLFVGIQDLDVVGSDGHSNKEEKAVKLNETGQANINILTEKEFIELAGLEDLT